MKLTVKQVAALRGCSVTRVNYLIRRGKRGPFPSAVKVKGDWVIDSKDIKTGDETK